LPIEARPRLEKEPTTLEEIKTWPFVQKLLRKVAKVGISVQELTKKFSSFDLGYTNYLPAHRIVGVLYHNFTNIFDSRTAIELQFELECLYGDHQVDYHEFIDVFFAEPTA
jgi:hypothetical protein